MRAGFRNLLGIRKNGTNELNFATTNFNDRGTISPRMPLEKQENHWYNYPLGRHRSVPEERCTL